jgi:chorismate mutase
MVEVKLPTVTVIGTCRVHDTLKEIESLGLIHLNNGGMKTFVHSLPEILLRVHVMQQKSKYLEDIVDLQVGVRSGVKLKPDDDFNLNNSDIIVIEISSLKAIYFQEHPLQFNEVNRHLCTPHGGFGIQLRNEIDLAFRNGADEIKVPKKSMPQSMPEKYKKIIPGLAPLLMNAESIRSYLKKLVDTLDEIPVLFVNHININGRNGGKISSRDKLCQMISKYCEQNNHPVFNPEILFEVYERKDLLAKEGNDLAHYATSALQTVGMAQYDKIRKILNEL